VVNLRPSTRLRDEIYLRRYVVVRFGDMPLDAIRQREVRAWVAWLLSQGLAPATVVKAYQLLSKVMTAAVDAGMLAQSPCRGVPLPKVEHEEMRYLNPAEIADLADKIHPAYRALVFVGAYGGLRIGELAALRRSRVDFAAGTVDVAETVNELKGKLVVGPPKTKASRRKVSLPLGVMEELADHLRAPGRPTDQVFKAQGGGQLRISNFRRNIWRPAVADANLAGLRIPRPSPHGGGAVDRSRGLAQGGRGQGGTHLGELRARPLRPPVPRGRHGSSGPAGQPVPRRACPAQVIVWYYDRVIGTRACWFTTRDHDRTTG